MKKSLALVARKKLVAYRKSSTAHSTATAKVKHDDDMEKTRLAAKVKPKPKAKEVTLKHRGHANQKVHNPKGGLGERASAATAAFRSKVRQATPYAKAAAAGTLEAVGGITASRGLSSLFRFGGSLQSRTLSGKITVGGGRRDLIKSGAMIVGGRQAQRIGQAIGRRTVARLRSNRQRAKVERFQNIVRTGVRTSYTVSSAALGAYRFYRANRPQIDAAVKIFLGKELETLVTAFKARKQASYDQLREAAIQTFRAAYPYTEGGTYRYVCEVYPDYMIVDEGGKYYKAGYSDDGVAAHGEWEEVARVTGWEAKELRAGLEVFKDKDDSYRWVLLSSNGFRDRDGEIVSTKALQHDVALWDLQDAPPDPLRFWHVALDDDHKNGLDLGYTDFRMVHNHTLIESGGFIDPVVGKAVHDAQDKLAASIGFRHSPKEPDSDKIYNTVRIFERSLLPKESASNLLTHLVVTDQETNNA